ncbi:type II toxin-antitoxin system RelB family antitoxin [Aerococcus urinaeequi]|uniref:type II toxin-antitoxin system RelB family antitoxin n=1 Tax=Aerococcus urinaeequi TaxID=51665 RepID=UPI003AD815A4
MHTSSFGVTDEEYLFIQYMTRLNNLSVSELVRTSLLTYLEKQIDITLYEKAMAQHQSKDESISHQEMLEELGF